jgi:ABC-type transport system involved in cytochrome c biogenesis permease subunit
MSVWILRLAAVLYVAAAAAYVTHFAKPRLVRAASWGYGLVWAAFAVHMASIGFACSEFRGAEFFTLRGGLVMTAWLVAGGFILLQRFYRLPAVGTFVTPIVLFMIAPALFGRAGEIGVVPEIVRLPALKVHIGAVSAGVAIFAIAFGVAVMYLLQEREVKGKHFGALFSRLPSLDALDRLTQRLVRAGFVVFTVGLVFGSLVAKKAWGTFWTWDAQLVFSLAVWVLYGAMVQLRHAGIHGRRYAVLTLAGFALIVAMIGLGQVPGLTRHQGTYQAQPGDPS